MAGPKVTVIGAGSYFFGKPVIHKMATSKVMRGGTLALVDTNKGSLKTMMRLAGNIFRHTNCGVKLIGSMDRREVLKNSDFVVLTFSDKNAYYRGVDTKIAAKHGIRMCSSDTIGPGGIFRSLREIPHVLDVAHDVQKMATDAWMINFINPTAVIGMALRRFAPAVKSFAICDSLHEPHNTLDWCKKVDILPADAKKVSPEVQTKLDLKIGGVNHCTWLTMFTYNGKDMLRVWRKKLAQMVRQERKDPSEGSKSRFNHAYSLLLFDLYGAYPPVVGHTKEYVPFFQGYGVGANNPEPIRLFDAEARVMEMESAWEKTERYASGKISPRTFIRNTNPDHAMDIIESMWGGLGKAFYINSPNRGAVTNLPDDAFLELRSDIDMHGPRPQPFGEFTRGLLALQQQILDTHELTAEAAVTGDRTLLRRAMLVDPICNNISDADACIGDLLEAQREALPSYWYRKAGK